ncbi:uncharacterized protein TM35_000252440 [Trypanosoma theileri]|uniref:Uncharacterized protein n=1 Tax=Trypanosoma theileri TaxID=67003 RepID=A0A1X0NQY8_9TRYP|nr:uncharacterized protein TM35_000252440 [Trypanosoma theileri]ORC86948.1 hypothetical protein TM35_000252440 [Trypanosoma theileri]
MLTLTKGLLVGSPSPLLSPSGTRENHCKRGDSAIDNTHFRLCVASILLLSSSPVCSKAKKNNNNDYSQKEEHKLYFILHHTLRARKHNPSEKYKLHQRSYTIVEQRHCCFYCNVEKNMPTHTP